MRLRSLVLVGMAIVASAVLAVLAVYGYALFPVIIAVVVFIVASWIAFSWIASDQRQERRIPVSGTGRDAVAVSPPDSAERDEDRDGTDEYWDSDELEDTLERRLPHDLELAVRRTIRKGVLTVGSTDIMRQGKPETVEVGIARTKKAVQELVESLTREPSATTEVKTSGHMEVTLKGDSFHIDPRSPGKQLVTPYVTWEFIVVPKLAGSHTLTVVGTCWIDTEFGERAIGIPAFEYVVTVKVDVQYRLKRAVSSWQVIVGMVVAIGTLVATWLALLK